MFIGRKKELEFLNTAYQSDHAEFIVLYGRRRIGKTELLAEFCKGKKTIFYSASETTDFLQLQSFSKTILRYDKDSFPFVDTFKDWETAFSALASLSGTERLVVVIDEFPYMVKSNGSIPSVLQNLWDHILKNTKIMLIVSGSSMSFIENEILGYKNPLYGRTTGIYKLQPLSFAEAIEFFPSYSDEDKVLAYSILGGIPHYLNQFDPTLSLEHNIKKSILRRGTVLYNEVDFLLHEELREPAVYNAIIEAIALGNSTLNDIYTKTQIDKRVLSVYLKNLNDLAIIKREFPILATPKEKTNATRGTYCLVDNLFRFWYMFCHVNISALESGAVDSVWNHLIKGELHRFAAKTFEDISIEYLKRKNAEEALPFWFADIGRWWGKVTKLGEDNTKITVSEEIDILAYDKSGKNFLLGECKFRNEPFDVAEWKKLQRKSTFHGKKYFYLFSLRGFTSGIWEEVSIHDNILPVSLSEIISSLKID